MEPDRESSIVTLDSEEAGLIVSSSARTGLQCMAGAETGSLPCPTVLPLQSHDLARHWQYKHPSLPLRDLVYMDLAGGAFLQLSDVFQLAAVCRAPGCDRVVFTSQQERAARRLSRHWANQHQDQVF